MYSDMKSICGRIQAIDRMCDRIRRKTSGWRVIFRLFTWFRIATLRGEAAILETQLTEMMGFAKRKSKRDNDLHKLTVQT